MEVKQHIHPRKAKHNPLTKEEVTGIPKQRPGQHLQCSVCGVAGHTLMKDGKDGYKHQNPSICTQVMKNQPKRTAPKKTVIPTAAEVMKYARPDKNRWV